MKRKILKIVLIILGFIPFIWLFCGELNDYYTDFSDIIDCLLSAIVKLIVYPWVLLGLIPICMGILLPLEKERIIKKGKNRKVFWKVLLVIGILPFAIPLLISFISAIFGLGLFYAEGLSGIDFLVLWSFIFWPTYVIGVFAIIISIIKINDLFG